MRTTGLVTLASFVAMVGMLSASKLLAADAAIGARPNVLFIFIDDLGYGDLGVTGNREVATPNIDRLAAQGIRFEQFYVASPICSPSRVAITTGQYPARHGIHSFLASRERNRRRGMKDFLDPEAPCIARAFQRAGYATGHFGKWHTGGGRDVDDAPLPQAYGFDESLVSFEGLGDRVLPGGSLSDASERLGRGKIERAPKHKLTEIYVERTLDFIRRRGEKPFYVHLWLNDVHDGHRPSEEQLRKFADASENPYARRFYAVLDEMDRQIGRLLRAIDEMGLGEETIVLLTGDNGPTAWPHYEREGWDAPGSTGGQRGRKWSLYEGGVRQPLIVRWTGKTPRGKVDAESVVAAIDFFPTVSKLAGIETPDVRFDGVDASRAWLGEPLRREKPIFWEYGRDESYLGPALPLDQSPNLAVREGRWKLLMNADGGRMELYDLAASPREFHNVAGLHPEVAATLSKKLMAWKDSLPGYPDGGPKLGEPRTVALDQGQSIDSQKFPAVANAEIQVAATVTTQGKDGVVLAHGGAAAGYSLYVKDGKPTFTVRTNSRPTTVTGKKRLPADKSVEIVARLAADRTMSLSVAGEEVGEEVARGKANELLNVQPVDPVNAGFDARGAVGDYPNGFRFGGQIQKLSVTVRRTEAALTIGRMVTRWAGDVDPCEPLPEYPRPQLVRQRWLNLNGHWQYAIEPKEAGRPKDWDGRIVVPFPVESQLSGVQRRVGAENRLWHRRTFRAPKAWREGRVVLHFGAVDWETTVWVNGREVGRHRGGYDPFRFEITTLLEPDDEQEIVVAVWDPTDEGPQPRGKQVRDPKGIWYTPVTGIWQTVWLEPVPVSWIGSLKLTPDVDAGQVLVDVNALGGTKADGPQRGFRATVLDGEEAVAAAEGTAGQTLDIPIPEPKLWSPDSPFLYRLKVELDGGDTLGSYFGLRKIEIRPDADGHDRLFLNGRPLFQFGLLDQGWWPDGLYTAPTDEALRFDIEATRRAGFNMARKHVKVEPARWYYWADRLGLLVWQDMPSAMQGGGRGPNHVRRGQADIDPPEGARRIFRDELQAMLRALGNHPSIVAWIPFNEGWGQHDTNETLRWVKAQDPTRLVGGPSGWEDRGYGDFKDIHRYPGPDMPEAEPGRASVLGEFGGLGLPVAGHTWVDRNNWGYRTYRTREELRDAYAALIGQLPALIDRGLAAAIYTQTTDVEIEVNGLLTYDRAVWKLPPEELRQLHRQLWTTPQ